MDLLLSNLSNNNNNSSEGGQCNDSDISYQQMYLFQLKENENIILKQKLKDSQAENEGLRMKNLQLESELIDLKGQLYKVKYHKILEKFLESDELVDENVDQIVDPTSSACAKSAEVSPISNNKETLEITKHSPKPSPRRHNTRALFVGNLTNHIDKNDLLKFFAKFGAIEYVTFPSKSQAIPSGLRYAFIKFVQSETVDKILAKSKTFAINGIEVCVSPAKDKY